MKELQPLNQNVLLDMSEEQGEQKTGESKQRNTVFYFHLNITGVDGCLPSTVDFFPIAFHPAVTDHDDPAGKIHDHLVMGGENKGHAALAVHLPHQFEKTLSGF